MATDDRKPLEKRAREASSWMDWDRDGIAIDGSTKSAFGLGSEEEEAMVLMLFCTVIYIEQIGVD